MKYVAYILTMPNKGSWDGKWSGEKDLHVRVRKINEAAWAKKVTKEPEIVGKTFTHDFGDGWTAQIEVKEVTLDQAKKLKSRSVGFSSYDWMIASLIKYGDIRWDQDLPKPWYF